MKNYRIFIIAAAALVLSACQEKESLAPQKQAIRFTTNLGAYTKATDTSFEEGDAVSLFAEAPINALNVKMVCSGGELIPETPIYWNEGQPANQYTNFFAVYPYRDDWEDLSDLSVFSVNADQRTHAQYTASDLLGASYMAYPDCETVPLNFTHRLCRLNVEVYTYSSGLSVADVYLKETYGKVRLGLYHRMEVYTVGEKGTIRMGKSYDNTWSAIVPPQAFDFPVVVVMSDGTMYEFAADSWSQVYMESAKSYTAHIEIDDRTTTISGSIAVENWTADNDAAFGNYIADEYHTEGFWYLMDVYTNDYYEMAYNSYLGDHFEIGVSVTPDSRYRLVYQNGRRELFYGLDDTGTATVGSQYALKENGTSFGFDTSGEIVVSVYPLGNYMSIIPDDEVWSIVGEFGDEFWNTDIDMVRESSGIYSIEFESHGEAFKLRANHSWDKNFGCYYKLQDMYRYPLTYYGDNMQFAEAGKYKIVLDSRNCTLTVRLLESFVSEQDFYDCIGKWTLMQGETPYDVTVYDAGYPNCFIDYDGFELQARYDAVFGRIKVCFDRLYQYQSGSYGLVYVWFYAETSEEVYYGEDEDMPLFFFEKSNDGNIQVSPAVYYGKPFQEFLMIGVLPESNYQILGAYTYSHYLPQTWTPAN